MRISTWGMSCLATKTATVLWAEHMKLHVNNVSLYFSFWSCKCKNWLIASFSLLKDCNHWIMNYSKKSRSRSIKSYCQASLRCVLIYLLLFQVVFKVVWIGIISYKSNMDGRLPFILLIKIFHFLQKVTYTEPTV